MFKLNCWIFNVTLVSDIPIYYAIIWYEDLQCSSRVQHVLDPACSYAEKSHTLSSLRGRILQVDERSVGWCLIRSVFTYKYLKTRGYIFFRSCNQADGMRTVFMRKWGQTTGCFTSRKKKSNKLFDSYNARIISVIFSPAQCCWCRSGSWWHAENVLHSFLRELMSKSLGGFLILLHQNRTRSS